MIKGMDSTARDEVPNSKPQWIVYKSLGNVMVGHPSYIYSV